jgi:predicted transcriptional regulator
MKKSMLLETTIPRMTLVADKAADIMADNPISLRDNASIREALVLFADKGFSAAPVIDDKGRPVGVISRFDIIVHDREKVEYATPDYYERNSIRTGEGEKLGKGFQVENVDRTRVRDLMTPAVFSVGPDTPAANVINEMLALKVHRMFVVDSSGVLVGVISALDVLRHLRL